MPNKTRNTIYELLTGDDEGRVCRDIPASACRHQPANVVRHVLSLGATKSGDGLADPKIVLAWLLVAVGAPVYLLGVLVPVREAGALLPQLFIARSIRAQPVRKWFWIGGSLVQGICVAGMGVAALLLQGDAAGWTIVLLLLLFALARSVCSVGYKDVLGKTVSKSLRGRTTGAATTLSSGVILLLGVLLTLGWLDTGLHTLAGMLFLAAGAWILAAVVFASIPEEAGATEGGANALGVAMEQFHLLREDAQLSRFILARCMLLTVALSPPFLLALSGDVQSAEPGRLGPLVLASALAALLSSYAWGRLADRSSRRVLMYAASLGAVALATTGLLALLLPGALSVGPVLPALLFLVLICYQGVRMGRAVHLVDMAGADRRAAYTALSNTLVGVCLLLAAMLGAASAVTGVPVMLLIFAAISALGARVAAGLAEAQ